MTLGCFIRPKNYPAKNQEIIRPKIRKIKLGIINGGGGELKVNNPQWWYIRPKASPNITSERQKRPLVTHPMWVQLIQVNCTEAAFMIYAFRCINYFHIFRCTSGSMLQKSNMRSPVHWLQFGPDCFCGKNGCLGWLEIDCFLFRCIPINITCIMSNIEKL